MLVAFLAIWHGGGYTYRLCKMPTEGKTGLIEVCFTKNILKFADNKTFWRRAWIGHRNDEQSGWRLVSLVGLVRLARLVRLVRLA